MESQFYATFHIAGFTYWDGMDVFERLKIGEELHLEAEPNNPHDPYAVKILFNNTKLGYIPRECNEEISKFLNFGHTDLFRVQISRVAPETHPEKQISVVVKIKKRES